MRGEQYCIADYGDFRGKLFCHLVVNGSDGLKEKDQEAFFYEALRAGPEITCSLVNVASDTRLEADIKRIPRGSGLFDKILQSAPCFLVCLKPIRKAKNIDEINLIPVRSFVDDLDAVVSVARMKELDNAEVFFRLLEFANRFIYLRPNIMGVGVDINEMIDGYIKAARLARTPQGRV